MTTDQSDMVIPIALFKGNVIDLDFFEPEDVDLGDIAHALSMVCRWSGHVRRFYSVAEHCVRVSYECERITRETWEHHEPYAARLVALDGLLHDAAEAYPPGDLAAPLKRALGRDSLSVATQARVDAAIRKRFGLPEAEARTVREADRVLLATEARDLMSTGWRVPDVEPLLHPIDVTWPPPIAELRYLLRYQQLRLADNGELATAVERLLPTLPEATSGYDRADHLLLRLLMGELGAAAKR